MVEEYLTRGSDGSRIRMTAQEIKDKIDEGTNRAAELAHIPPLSGDEQEHLYEIVTNPERIVSVEQGREVVLNQTNMIYWDQSNGGVSLPLSPEQTVELIEKDHCADEICLIPVDCSLKALKPVYSSEQSIIQNTLHRTIAPLCYGIMANMVRYTTPAGPFPEPLDLIRRGKLDEAKESMEKAIDNIIEDYIFLIKKIYEAGIDAVEVTTVNAMGDPEFYAALKVIEQLKKEIPGLAIHFDTVGEFILGFHCDLKYDNQTLAGMYPHKQLKMAEKAGADAFSTHIYITPKEPFPYDLAKSVTMIKEQVKAASIPIFMVPCMGCFSISMCDLPPLDVTSRAIKAFIEIANVDMLWATTGDPYMHVATATFGIGGVRAGGDLVARIMEEKKYKIMEAKGYVAKKLGVDPVDLSDEFKMKEVRDKFNIGTVLGQPGVARGFEAKHRIADLLDIRINSVERFKRAVGA